MLFELSKRGSLRLSLPRLCNLTTTPITLYLGSPSRPSTAGRRSTWVWRLAVSTLRLRIREIAQACVRYGYRKIPVLLNRESWKLVQKAQCSGEKLTHPPPSSVSVNTICRPRLVCSTESKGSEDRTKAITDAAKVAEQRALCWRFNCPKSQVRVKCGIASGQATSKTPAFYYGRPDTLATNKYIFRYFYRSPNISLSAESKIWQVRSRWRRIK